MVDHPTPDRNDSASVPASGGEPEAIGRETTLETTLELEEIDLPDDADDDHGSERPDAG